MRTLRILVGVMASLGIGIGIGAASDTPYRLAGVITPDSGRTMALIETLDGEQQLLRVGDAIDDGRVTEITPDTVRLQFADGEFVLQLAGTSSPQGRLPEQYRREDYAASESKPIDVEALGAIVELASSVENTEAKELASKVLTYLDLPSEARIMAINDQPVASAADAVRQMADSIDEKSAKGSAFKFVVSIAAAEGNQRVYVFANNGGQVTGQTIFAK